MSPEVAASRAVTRRAIRARSPTTCPRAVAAGYGPTVSVSCTTGGALAAGNGPTIQITVGQGGGAAAGSSPVARATTSTGGGIASGLGPGSSASCSAGGASAPGVAPSGALVTVGRGGAAAGGFGIGLVLPEVGIRAVIESSAYSLAHFELIEGPVCVHVTGSWATAYQELAAERALASSETEAGGPADLLLSP